MKKIVLGFDEMSIRPALRYLSSIDKIVGYDNFRSNEYSIATRALVLKVSVCDKWKQMDWYFLSFKGVQGDIFKKLLREVIEKFHDKDLTVWCVVCDQGTNNIKLASCRLIKQKHIFCSWWENLFYVRLTSFDVSNLWSALALLVYSVKLFLCSLSVHQVGKLLFLKIIINNQLYF